MCSGFRYLAFRKDEIIVPQGYFVKESPAVNRSSSDLFKDQDEIKRVYIYGWFMLMFGRNQQNVVKMEIKKKENQKIQRLNAHTLLQVPTLPSAFLINCFFVSL